jgi:flagellar biosynthesis/type III secretory pathway ATPase
VSAAAAPAALDGMLAALGAVPRLAEYGKVTRVVGLVIEAAGLDVGLGELCRVTALSGDRSVLAEAVGFHEKGVLLMPLGEMDGLHPGSAVRPLGRSFGVDVGPGLLGRILNGLGHPIDGLGKLDARRACRSPPSRPTRSRARWWAGRSRPACGPSTARSPSGAGSASASSPAAAWARAPCSA